MICLFFDIFSLSAAPIETSTPITEQPISSSGEQQTSTTAPVFGVATGMSFADLAKNTNNTNSASNTNKPFSFANLAQNNSNGSSVDQNSTSNAPVFGALTGMSFADLAKNSNNTCQNQLNISVSKIKNRIFDLNLRNRKDLCDRESMTLMRILHAPKDPDNLHQFQHYGF